MTIANLTPSFTRGMTALFAAFFLMFALAAWPFLPHFS
jgi:hypothetical protein